MSDVIAKVISRKGPCETHKVGDEFVMGEKTPPNVCSRAFHSHCPFAQVLLYGGSFPWEQDPNKAIMACRDAENPLTFELRRTPP
jgi:uncharacterized repeat protein (TIGR04076 family)